LIAPGAGGGFFHFRCLFFGLPGMPVAVEKLYT